MDTNSLFRCSFCGSSNYLNEFNKTPTGRRKKICSFCEREKRLIEKEANERIIKKSYLGYLKGLDPELIKIEKSLYQTERVAKNPTLKLSRNISQAIRTSLKNGKEGNHWENLVSFSLNDLVGHLESNFQQGMSWNNYGEWEIDHIVPISKWNFKSYKDLDFKKCWSLSNLQPLWALDNIKKSNKFCFDYQFNKRKELENSIICQ